MSATSEHSIIRQNEIFEGRTISYTLQLPLSENLMGFTGFPFNISLAVTPRGGTDNKGIEHRIMNIVIPVANLVSPFLVLDDQNYPRFSKDKKSVLFSIRGKFCDASKIYWLFTYLLRCYI